MNEANLPAVEPVTDEDLAAVSSILDPAARRAILEQDRRRVAERQAARLVVRAPFTDAMVRRLREISHAVTQGPEALRRECSMRVPAEPDRDADLVLASAADEIERLRAEVARYEELLKVRDDIEPLPQLLTDGARAHYLTPAQVKAFHPCDTKRFDEDNAARTMVSERHGKGDLVLLVTAILCQLADARAEVAAHRKHDVLRCDALMKAEAEVARLTAACAAKDAVIVRFLNAPLVQRDGAPVPPLLAASARAALSDTAGRNYVDASGAVEGKIAQGHLSTRQVWTAKDAIPAEWIGLRVLIVPVKENP